ncbi:hypothetical protein RhiirC2_714137 [Rhizophagus irregularis]|uniref:Uncharacterized protein n=1 Tax=Rhizophagus irregularis TaxID=588596 RepID=A0A2N1N0L1_9GLOM|nr:hypothetical protein RhiirC2_714137 [Rhizophagus irregularis]
MPKNTLSTKDKIKAITLFEEAKKSLKKSTEHCIQQIIQRRVILHSFRSWVNETRGLINTFTLIKYKELADMIRVYKVNRDTKIVSTPFGYETMKMDKGKVQEIPVECPKTDIEHK